MRGRKPNSAHIHVANGDPSKIGAKHIVEPKPRASKPKLPDDTDPRVAVEFRKACRELEHMGLLFASDEATILAYAQTVVLQHDLMVEMRGGIKPVVFTAKGETKNPLLAAWKETCANIVSLGSSLGFNAAARARLGNKERGKGTAGGDLQTFIDKLKKTATERRKERSSEAA